MSEGDAAAKPIVKVIVAVDGGVCDHSTPKRTERKTLTLSRAVPANGQWTFISFSRHPDAG